MTVASALSRRSLCQAEGWRGERQRGREGAKLIGVEPLVKAHAFNQQRLPEVLPSTGSHTGPGDQG